MIQSKLGLYPSVQELREFWEDKSTQLHSNIPTISRPNHEHELVACHVKTITIKEILFYEIELVCSQCNSSFKVRASHECHSSQGHDDAGLEWLETNDGENVNLAF